MLVGSHRTWLYGVDVASGPPLNKRRAIIEFGDMHYIPTHEMGTLDHRASVNVSRSEGGSLRGAHPTCRAPRCTPPVPQEADLNFYRRRLENILPRLASGLHLHLILRVRLGRGGYFI